VLDPENLKTNIIVPLPLRAKKHQKPKMSSSDDEIDESKPK